MPQICILCKEHVGRSKLPGCCHRVHAYCLKENFQTNDSMKCPEDTCSAKLRAQDIAKVIHKYKKEFFKERFQHLQYLMYVRVLEVMSESDLSEGYLMVSHPTVTMLKDFLVANFEHTMKTL